MRLPHGHHVRRAIFIVAGLLLAGWLIPPFFHAGRYRKALQAALQSKLGRRVELGSITLRVLPHPGFSIANVVVEEDPRFGSEPFARIDTAECDLGWRSLAGKRMDCSRIYLDHPEFNVVRAPGGAWNVESIFHRTPPAAPGSKIPSGEAARISEAPFNFEAEHARINFTWDGTEKPFALDGVRARFRIDPSRGALDFSLQGAPVRTDITLLQPPGIVYVSGEWKPAAGSGQLSGRLTTANSLLYAWIPMLFHRDPGIYGLVSADISFKGSTAKLAFSGKMNVAELHRWESSPPSPPPTVKIAFAGSWDLARQRLEIARSEADFASSRLRLSGSVERVRRDPNVNLTLALDHAFLQDLLVVGDNLVKYPARLGAAGRIDGALTVQGQWNALRYGGAMRLESARLADRRIEIAAPRAEVQVDDEGARLLPARFTLAPGIEGMATGILSPALPGAAAPSRRARRSARQVHPPRYEFVLTARHAPLHAVIQAARRWGVGGLRNLDAVGAGDASVRLDGGAWPFTRPKITAHGEVASTRLLVAGLTEPVLIRHLSFEVENGVFSATPVTVGIGNASFSGWLKRGPAHGTRDQFQWQFAAQTPSLSLEQASLWFSAIGARPSSQLLDLIPGLRSLEGRRAAQHDLFANLDATGAIESPRITFRSLTLRNFHAGLTLSDQVARISSATFRLGDGRGAGSASVSFRQSPAAVAGTFKLTGVKVQNFAQKLPAELTGLRGLLSASGRFTTRGITRQEMAAQLEGRAAVEIKNLFLGKFDPVGAAARAASLGVLEPLRRAETIPALRLTLLIKNRAVILAPARVPLSGAILRADGTCDFSGRAAFLIHADLTHVSRGWLIDAPPGPSLRRDAVIDLTGPIRRLTATTEAARLH